MDLSGGIATDFFKNLFTLFPCLSSHGYFSRAACRPIPIASCLSTTDYDVRFWTAWNLFAVLSRSCRQNETMRDRPICRRDAGSTLKRAPMKHG